MFESATAHTMIAVSDLERAKVFYGGTLGLITLDEQVDAGTVRYKTAGDSWFVVYRSQFAGTAKSTYMRFEVADVETAVGELRERGVVFEEYDLPGVETTDGIAEVPGVAKGAWFKDPDGNILEVGQLL